MENTYSKTIYTFCLSIIMDNIMVLWKFCYQLTLISDAEINKLSEKHIYGQYFFQVKKFGKSSNFRTTLF